MGAGTGSGGEQAPSDISGAFPIEGNSNDGYASDHTPAPEDRIVDNTVGDIPVENPDTQIIVKTAADLAKEFLEMAREPDPKRPHYDKSGKPLPNAPDFIKRNYEHERQSNQHRIGR